ncbi:hypothetical protein [Synechococcus sp. PCC 6312]|uniref:hypothetical protein n=1 Tax=Synechococcus sp. (strain ATCC 27167 / PCC 6312) TaxID=195253 RepID=UPI00029F2663|nr:hypothetical protein [Synechococcus sp. PCC 6312]AFY61856.1 hypothetical protein Syn6312_2776 [Synechococcus sp. PCC 6312]
MKLIYGSFWKDPAEIVVPTVTTNSVIKKDGTLVMGKGTALEAANRDPSIPGLAGDYIQRTCGNLGFYGFIIVNGIGLFQSKTDWKEPSTLSLIQQSATVLQEFIETTGGKVVVAMPIPGTGLGGLNKEDVLNILKTLPDTVHIYEWW